METEDAKYTMPTGRMPAATSEPPAATGEMPAATSPPEIELFPQEKIVPAPEPAIAPEVIMPDGKIIKRITVEQMEAAIDNATIDGISYLNAVITNNHEKTEYRIGAARVVPTYGAYVLKRREVDSGVDANSKNINVILNVPGFNPAQANVVVPVARDADGLLIEEDEQFMVGTTGERPAGETPAATNMPESPL